MNFILDLDWPKALALFFLAIVGAYLGELVTRSSPKFGIFGSLVLAVLGAWICVNLPIEIPIEPIFQGWPIGRGILGSAFVVALFSYWNRQTKLR